VAETKGFEVKTKNSLYLSVLLTLRYYNLYINLYIIESVSVRQKLPSYLILRHNTYSATLAIPEDVRAIFAGKPRFTKSLQTDSLSLAERRKWEWIDHWKGLIKGARNGDPLVAEARAALAMAYDEGHGELIKYELEDVAYDNVTQTIDQKIVSAVRVASGDWVKLSEMVPRWTKHMLEINEVKPKTLDDFTSVVNHFLKSFTYLHDVQTDQVSEWLLKQELSISTMKKKITALRGFLIIAGAPKRILDDVISESKIPKSQRKAKSIDKRKHFEDVDLHRILAAVDDQDHMLTDLIKLGMFTGCRIEELCSLKLENITDTVLQIRNAKTDSGDRDVPIHVELRQLVTRLIAGSTDGYLLSGLTLNKYGDRSNAIGKRFGRLKTKLGFDRRLVFHSIRKSFITKLERAEVAPASIARVVGHEIGSQYSLALSVYSAGLSEEQISAIVNKVSYS
jgi:integrase